MSENVLGPQFYHGSPAFLNIGDVIEPHRQDLPGRPHLAYATTSPFWASKYANAGNKDPEGQGTLFGTVYNVEPLDPEEMAHQRPEDSSIGQVTSRKGFRVTGVHSHIARKHHPVNNW